VTSDANAGAGRTKTVSFTAVHGGQTITRTLTILQETGMELVSITYNDVCITYDDTAIAYPYVKAPDYLTFTALAASTIRLNNIGGNAPIVYYSINDGNFTLWDYSSISLNTGDVVRMYGENGTQFNKSSSIYSTFIMSGSISASGDATSLLTERGTDTIGDYCFVYLFQRCGVLTSAPELPATNIGQRCYLQMFNNCPGLVSAPSILPSMTLKASCYTAMFGSCSSLTTAPILPAITLTTGCYNTMFAGCSSLSYIKAMFTTTPTTSYTNNWVNGVNSTGTFVKNSSAQWDVIGAYGVPSGWTIQTENE
jgi:hypothetical protein